MHNTGVRCDENYTQGRETPPSIEWAYNSMAIRLCFICNPLQL